jgi:hypothetical protein
VRLAIAYKHGGHVVPFDFVKLPVWRLGQTVRPYLVLGAAGDVGWFGSIGPLGVPGDSHPLPASLMAAMASILDDCAHGAYNSAAEAGYSCAISWRELYVRANEPGSCAGNAIHLLEPAMAPTTTPAPDGTGLPVCRFMLVGHAAVAGLADAVASARTTMVYSAEVRSYNGFHAYLGPGPFLGLYTAHVLVGQRDLSATGLLPQMLAGLGHPHAQRGTGPWHQGCHRPTIPAASLLAGQDAIQEAYRTPVQPEQQPSLRDRLMHAQTLPAIDPTFNTFGYLVALKSFNLGDDVQAFASVDMLPFVGVAVNRDRWQYMWALTSAVGRANTRAYPDFPAESIFTIMNGWWDTLVREAPNSVASALLPVFSGFHMARYRSNSRAGPGMATILRPYAPVGTRDLHTLAYLHNNTVPAFLAGCMTTTLRNAWPGERRLASEVVLLVPKYEEDIAVFRRILPPAVLARARWVSIHIERTETRTVYRRSMRAWGLMHQYATAGLVITSALHAALPSIAMDTPTLFVHDAAKFAADERFPGLADLFPSVRTFTNVTGVLTDFDFDTPQPPSAFPASHARLQAMRAAQRARVRSTCPAVHVAATLFGLDDDDKNAA